MKTNFFGLIFIVGTLGACSGSDSSNPENVINPVKFENIRAVNISGYSGSAMEPSISRDGLTLFFNNLNSDTLPDGTENDTNLHYATRLTADSFQYQGEIQGGNKDAQPGVNELEGVASMDQNHRFYFVDITDYADNASPNFLRSIFRADFVSGSLINIESQPNLKHSRLPGQNPQLGELNFDVEINEAGDRLYFAEGIFAGNPFPETADIGVAIEVAGEFEIMTSSVSEFAQVNSVDLEYAPSIGSNGLEFYFTRASGNLTSGFNFGIYVANRDKVTDPWSNVAHLTELDGEVTEGPSISSDGNFLYFHQKIGNVFQIFVAEKISP